MARTFKYKEAVNIVKSVCCSYITREEIDEYFEKNFDKKHIFSQDEIKAIVLQSVKGRKRITKTFKEIEFHKSPKYAKNNIVENSNEER